MTEVTRILEAAQRGDPQAASQLMPLVYAELRRLAALKMAQEKPGHTLDATALVHEAYLRLTASPAGEAAADPKWQGRRHFFAAAAEAMRRILVENARRKRRTKHGGGLIRTDLSGLPAPAVADDILALDEALELLAQEDALKAELVKLRYFAGLTADQAAAALGISPSTADRYWNYARAWLFRALSSGDSRT